MGETPLTTCLLLPGSSHLAARVRTALSAAGRIQIEDAAGRSLRELNDRIAEGDVSFAVVAATRPVSVDQPLAASIPLRAVNRVPLLVVADWTLNEGEQERLRLAGATHIADTSHGAKVDREVLEGLCGASSWLTADIGKAPVTAILQRLTDERGSGMLSVECPHLAPFSDSLWAGHGPFKCVGQGARCLGFRGRIYVQDGDVVHAETPRDTGADALQRMYNLRRGTVRVHEVFVAPTTQGGESVEDVLIIEIDEPPQSQAPPPIPRARNESSHRARTTRGTGPSRQPAHPGTRHTKQEPSARSTNQHQRREATSQQVRQAMKSGINTLLKVAPNLRVAAKSDNGGNAMEVHGEGDGESVCAVAAMCSTPINRFAELLGLGSAMSWSMTTQKVSLYVQQDGDEIVAVLGASTKNPGQTLNKLNKSYNQTAK